MNNSKKTPLNHTAYTHYLYNSISTTVVMATRIANHHTTCWWCLAKQYPVTITCRCPVDYAPTTCCRCLVESTTLRCRCLLPTIRAGRPQLGEGGGALWSEWIPTAPRAEAVHAKIRGGASFGGKRVAVGLEPRT